MATIQPLKISTNRRFFCRPDGRPFFWLGDTAWALWMRLDRASIEHYLDNAVANGFSVIQVFLAAKEWAWPDGRLTNALGEPPFIDGDPLRPNPAYLDLVAWTIEQAAARGLYTFFVIGEPMREDTPFRRITDVETAYCYGRNLGERFREQTLSGAILWGLGIDYFAEQGIGVPGWRAMADGVADGVNGASERGAADFSTFLMGFHPKASSSSGRVFYQDGWLDFHMHQTWLRYEQAVPLTQADYALEPTHPVISGEPGYENAGRPEMGLERIGDWHARFQAYWAVFNGAAGYTYGNKHIFPFGGELAEGRYPAALGDPGRAQMRHVRTLMESHSLLAAVPDAQLLVGARGEPDREKVYICALRSTENDYAYVYSTNGQSFDVDLTRLAGSAVRAAWFDPRSGVESVIGRLAKSERQQFAPPGTPGPNNDWVLVLDAVV